MSAGWRREKFEWTIKPPISFLTTSRRAAEQKWTGTHIYVWCLFMDAAIKCWNNKKSSKDTHTISVRIDAWLSSVYDSNSIDRVVIAFHWSNLFTIIIVFIFRLFQFERLVKYFFPVSSKVKLQSIQPNQMSKKAAKSKAKSNVSKPFNVYVGVKSYTTNSCSKSKRFISDVVNYSLSVGKDSIYVTGGAVCSYVWPFYQTPLQMKWSHVHQPLSNRCAMLTPVNCKFCTIQAIVRRGKII